MGRRGYSLVEMMVAIVVLGILTSVALFKISQALPHQRVNQAATVVAGDVQYAQQLAVKQRAPILLSVDSGAKSYSIKDRLTNTVYRTTQLGSSTSFQLDQLTIWPGNLVVFPNGNTYPMGTSSNTTTHVVVGLKGYTKWVTITWAGLIRIQ